MALQTISISFNPAAVKGELESFSGWINEMLRKHPWLREHLCGHVDIMRSNLVGEDSLTIDEYKFLMSDKGPNLALDVHLMEKFERVYPQRVLEPYIENRSPKMRSLAIHAEATQKSGVDGMNEVKSMLDHIRRADLRAGVSVDLNSRVTWQRQGMVQYADDVLYMSVPAGGSGRAGNLKRALTRIEKYRGFNPNITIDGGVKPEILKLLHEAGVNIAVVGNAIFNSPDRESALLSFVSQMVAQRGERLSDTL